MGWTITALLTLAPPLDAADENSHLGAPILEKYVQALGVQKEHPEAVSMEVSIDASVPRLKKKGRLHALRFITKLGKVFYRPQDYEGDNLVKKEVIGQYLRAETEAREKLSSGISVVPENYKFRYKGTTKYNDRTAYVFQVSPKKSKVGTYKGEIWVDSETYLPLREWGVLAKNPSVFLKNVYFVRDYSIYHGIQVPRRLITNVDTRLVGPANLTIWFDKFKLDAAAQAEQAKANVPEDGDSAPAADGAR